MELNLHRYHTKKELLVGYNHLTQIPHLILKKIETLYNKSTPDSIKMLRDLLLQNRKILAKSPKYAVQAALIFQRTAKKSDTPNDVDLWPMGHPVEKIIAQEPEFLCMYLAKIHDNPKYHSQLLKADPSNLAVYVFNREKELYKQPEFLTKILKKFSDPQQAFSLALNMSRSRRLKELEPAIFNYNPDPAQWGKDWDLYIHHIKTNKPANVEGELDSPWHIYVSSLESVKDRVDAIKQYGFKGDEFRLGTKAELRFLQKYYEHL